MGLAIFGCFIKFPKHHIGKIPSHFALQNTGVKNKNVLINFINGHIGDILFIQILTKTKHLFFWITNTNTPTFRFHLNMQNILWNILSTIKQTHKQKNNLLWRMCFGWLHLVEFIKSIVYALMSSMLKLNWILKVIPFPLSEQ